MSRSLVSVVRCPDYDPKRVKQSVQALLAPLGGMQSFVSTGQTVLIKPNLIHGTPPERGATTHPEVLRAVIGEVRDAGGIPVVGESPGYESFTTAARKSGLLQVIEELRVPVVAFDAWTQVQLEPGHLVPSLPIADPVAHADVVISLPKIKSHGLVVYTGCVKNMFGVICGTQKAQYHLRFQDREAFSRLLAEIYAAARPALSILDGIVGMDGNGPRNGDPAPLGIMLAGADGVAVDAVACRIVGIDPLESPPIRIAAQMGLGTASLHEIDLAGPPIETLKAKGFRAPRSVRPSVRQSLMSGRAGRVLRNLFTTRPAVNPVGCRGCTICARACPSQAIEMRNGKARVDYNKCVRCYCCQEVCEHGAIELATPPLARLLRR